MNISLVPRSDMQQRLRLRRFFMASATYLVTALLFVAAAVQGLISVGAVCIMVGAIILVNLFFYGVIRSGFNLRFRDPSLTMPQIAAANLLLILMVYYAGEARGIFLLLYITSFVFGVFRLQTRHFLALSIFSLTSYALVVLLLAYRQPEVVDLSLEFMRWIALVAALTWFSFLGGYISRLRHRLKTSNKKLQEAMATIADMAVRDELTGLFNRRYLMNAIKHEKDRADRFGKPFSVAVLDIDWFKQINDRFGHLAGDKVLRRFAQVAESHLRAVDVFGRYGGEEFMVIMPGTTLEQARVCAERIRHAVEQEDYAAVLGDLSLTVSVGLAEYRLSEDIAPLLERADSALYRAKHSGRNRVECFAAA
ncbi:hypothetical protein CAI21_08105 [Alkalilimnicola ehrlichii]|uniref:diguanylate cyclase n=2 Tax=Alkalilimnicola ehrlichii TaxID=351052 RepID=A0A3E0WWZ5_9GAMM|nr:GGDEF domain-containing protein [Alkalilimnicola ehrlichii]RFA30144.1 hypothetical protein CAI21_08105 [Alkalilimnicola ehrlichii]RFA37492.1 hypothetical protein CAL65_09450 [Alkalilimnicola ehrlichii]